MALQIVIGKHIAVQKPLTVTGIQFDKDESGKKEQYINAKGEKLTKHQMQKAEYKWMNDVTNAEEKTKGYKSIKGKPAKAFSKTTKIDNYETIDLSDINLFVENEKTYQLINPGLKAELKTMLDTNRTISFKYVNSGFKVYKAVLVIHDDKILMRCFRGDLRKLDLTEDNVDEVKVSDDGVEALDLDALDV